MLRGGPILRISVCQTLHVSKMTFPAGMENGAGAVFNYMKNLEVKVVSDWTKEELEKVLLDLKKKAMQDAAFRQMALSDAPAAIKEIAGKDLPEGMKLKFVENDGGYMTIVLPDLAAGEMSEEDLDKVAGGTLTALLSIVCPTSEPIC